ncbi:MAG: tRNA (guanosine(46)-N7)-methyltransferase TrmB [Lactobacillus sp.]|jgi:tRNA (guanine-N7-)-methyltransferase|uniref:tRNA (guanine-N(7)-)-methyltransferase n=1 Tax=Lacticaseibacillus suilingensis TaxID=2799577 RepID=A0ABW4BFL6_9LACO|nr:tRNA (guanosine(46)-N7)-methyltransferase TrmB [Lacticaseibacillus suilingensis]MCI1894871.1 tRNA (guanosine(46)-N7)-methyltransferase TrmB [Lactobacillus sp.]MCI1917465.1 tRNA (guanosine(46)-N7)-methyltransferase TrmB [Lactobacillus sp.]MCI1940620.1 tRNA (guanosine(46)-N7)-methyltransferase TrmB [Lactobacillus sp.]MCI1971306.1 tRNA (guanosine(46)-N7)-methyltransferase TrmB [Lactobacillus sp.]MCI2017781.1 tRNA (guanosine(46)-N7)-methyltransferase TrmB [Lactobacillus sp.]
MRLRNKPWAAPLIAANPDLISVRPVDMAGKWQAKFSQQQPLYLEVGSGKGQFIIEMAKAHPDRNYIALEIQEVAIAYILRKQVALQLPNLHLVLGDGADLTDYFAPAEVAGLFLNFSDPWPKSRHEKRRLTYRHFLQQYQAIMAPNGILQFKTDNQGLFEFSLVSMNNYGMVFDLVALDLHHDPRVTDNIETEYEHKFSSQGGRIYELVARFPQA